MAEPLASDDSPLSFEEALAELERIADKLEDGELPLDEALALYETGVRRLRRCHALLENAERKITLLSGVADDGAAVTEPFEEPDATLEEKAATRSRRRSRPAAEE
jgi:exodeoxyribonuclease VII small subunit